MTAVIIPAALRDVILAEARAAAPRECCGLLEGTDETGAIVITMVHPAHNLAAQPDRFEIDPADHFQILREACERGSRIVGCYHSHPDGRPEPSLRDRDGAAETGFIWLIATTGMAAEIEAYVFDGRGFSQRPLSIGGSLDPVRALRV